MAITDYNPMRAALLGMVANRNAGTYRLRVTNPFRWLDRNSQLELQMLYQQMDNPSWVTAVIMSRVFGRRMQSQAVYALYRNTDVLRWVDITKSCAIGRKVYFYPLMPQLSRLTTLESTVVKMYGMGVHVVDRVKKNQMSAMEAFDALMTVDGFGLFSASQFVADLGWLHPRLRDFCVFGPGAIRGRKLCGFLDDVEAADYIINSLKLVKHGYPMVRMDAQNCYCEFAKVVADSCQPYEPSLGLDPMPSLQVPVLYRTFGN